MITAQNFNHKNVCHQLINIALFNTEEERMQNNVSTSNFSFKYFTTTTLSLIFIYDK